MKKNKSKKATGSKKTEGSSEEKINIAIQEIVDNGYVKQTFKRLFNNKRK